MPQETATITANLAALRGRIAAAATRSGRPPEEITLVAVSKTFPGSAIRAAWEAGVRHFGENRVQEWESKQSAVADVPAIWHLVGHLQSNKARRAAALFGCVDSLDSADLARRLDTAVAERGKEAGSQRLRVLVEVCLASEESKSGVEPGELESLARSVLALRHLELAGLMCIPPFAENPEEARPYFRRLRELRDALRGTLAHTPAARDAAARGEMFLPVLSMGMSHDFEVAIEEGATEIRIGTAVFGTRGITPAP